MRQDRSEPKRIFAKMRWGIIPYWAKNMSIGAETINAVCGDGGREVSVL